VKAPPKVLPKGHVHLNPARWKALSKRARRMQPWCLDCGTTEDLTTDHVIPVSEAPELAYKPANIAVRCRPCNSRRGDRCTDTERAEVETRLTRGEAPAGGDFRRAPKAKFALLTEGSSE
jgi:5-methylcytosine-specific restriction endonuclease McrA